MIRKRDIALYLFIGMIYLLSFFGSWLPDLKLQYFLAKQLAQDAIVFEESLLQMQLLDNQHNYSDDIAFIHRQNLEDKYHHSLSFAFIILYGNRHLLQDNDKLVVRKEIFMEAQQKVKRKIRNTWFHIVFWFLLIFLFFLDEFYFRFKRGMKNMARWILSGGNDAGIFVRKFMDEETQKDLIASWQEDYLIAKRDCERTIMLREEARQRGDLAMIEIYDSLILEQEENMRKKKDAMNVPKQ